MQDDAQEISRVTRSKQEARASYDRLSRWYDALAGKSERGLVALGLEWLDLEEGESVLEIGFGTGQAIVAMAGTVGGAGRVCGLDLSAGMCRVAQARVRQAGLAAGTGLWCGDATAIPCASASFDTLFMSFALELFDTPEIAAVLKECRRVLRSGGRLAVVAMSRPGRPGAMLRLYEWAHRTFPKYVDCRPIRVQEALQNAGFLVNDVALRSTWGLPVEIVVASSAGPAGG